MERINIDTLPETNVDWYADGERANAAVLNRPIKQVAGIVNTLIDAVTGIAGQISSFASFAEFPNTGTTGVLYVDNTTKKQYSWDETKYVEIKSQAEVSAAIEAISSVTGQVSSYDSLAEFPNTGETDVVYVDSSTKKHYAWDGTKYVELKSQAEISAVLDAKQDTLVSGTNIKTINGESLLGSGNITVTAAGSQEEISSLLDAKQEALVSGTNIKTINGQSILGSGDITVAAAGAGAKPSLQGNPASFIGQTKTYTITNYSSFSSYAVTASAGTASVNEDTITFTAPGTAGNVSLTVTEDGVPTVFTLTVQPSGIQRPTNVSPAANATDVKEKPTLTSSAFVAVGSTDTHLSSRWRVYQGATLKHDSGWLTNALTSYGVPGGVLEVSKTYTWTVEHRGVALGDSAPSLATGFTTAATFNSYIPTPTATPAEFGAPLEGGFYAGMVWEQLVQSSTSTAIGTGSKTFTVPDMTDVPIVYNGQLLEVRSRANPANKMVGTVTSALGTSLTINVTSVQGTGTFSDWSVMARFRVIVAPKSSGENAAVALKNANDAFPTACQTLTEGYASTEAMKSAGTSTVYPAAHWARGLNIGGKTDWYIPARDELELCWRNLKPVTNNNYVTADRPTGQSFDYKRDGSYGDTANTHGTNNNSSPTGAAYTASVPVQTAATPFRSGGAEAFEFGSAYYWSSSECSASDAWFQYWHSSFPGYQVYSGKNNAYRVRAVRRSII